MEETILQSAELQEAPLGSCDTGAAETTGEMPGVPDPEPAEDRLADGQEVSESKEAAFARLIRGDYKEQYDARIRDTLQKRLKGARENREKLEQLAPVMEALGRKYGVDPADPAALHRALSADMPPEETPDEAAKRIVSQWEAEAAAAREKYPALDLETEIRQPRFAQLLRAGVDVETAYAVVHRQELLPAAMAHTARDVEQRLTNKILAQAARPAENGIDPGAPASVKSEVSQLTKKDRAEIIRRVARGEKIRF